MKRYIFLLTILLTADYVSAAEVYFIKPKNGEHIKGPTVEVVFGLKDMGVAPAGVNIPETGHHHLLVDYAGLPDLTKPMPASKHLTHFGGGQTQTVVKDLKKGKHQLRLILGDFTHTPHKPPIMSQEITIHVD